MSVTLSQSRTSKSGQGKSTGASSDTTGTQTSSGGLGSQEVGNSGIIEQTLNYLLGQKAAKDQKRDEKKAREAEEKRQKAETKALNKANKREVKEAGYIAKYEELLAKADSAQAKLAEMLRCGDLLLELTQAIRSATAEADKGLYKTGRDILDAAKIDSIVKDGQAAHEQALQDGRKGFPEAFQKSDKLRQSVAAEADVLTDADITDFLQQAQDAIAGLAGPAPQIKDGIEACATLDAAQLELKKRSDSCRAAKDEAAAALKELATFEAKEAGNLPAEYLTEFKYQLTQCKTRFEGKEYEAAAETLAGLLVEARRRKDQGKADWDKLATRLGTPIGDSNGAVPERKARTKPSILDPNFFTPPGQEEETPQQPKGMTAEVDQLLTEARALQAQASVKGHEVPPVLNTPPTAAGTLTRLRTLQAAITNGTIGVEMTPGQALAELDACADEIKLNKERLKDYVDPDLVMARDDLQGDVDAATRWTTNAIIHLQKAAVPLLPDGTDPNKLTQAFQGELNDLIQAWDRQKKAAVRVNELTVPTDVIAQLNELRGKIRAVYHADAKEVVTNVQALADAAQKRDLDAAIAACAEKIDRIVALNAQKGLAADGRYQEIRKAAAAAKGASELTQCETDIATLAKELDTSIKEETAAVDTLRKSIAAELVKAKAARDQFDAAVTKQQKQDDYKGLRERFANEIAEQELLSSSGDKTFLEGVATDLAKTIANINKAQAAVNGEKGADDTLYTNEDVRKAIKQRRDKLRDKTLVQYLSRRQLELQSMMDMIEEHVDELLPQETYAQLQEWDGEFREAKTQAVDAKNEIITFTAKVEKVSLELKDPVFKDAKGYVAVLEAKLKGCIDTARSSGDLAAAEQTLIDVASEIVMAKQDPAKRGEGQKNADENAQRAKVEKAQWDAYYKAFDERITKQTSWLSSQRDELQQMAEQANDVYKKSGDFATARKQLAVAERRADYYQTYPEGQDVAVRAKLPKVVADCSMAFKAMRAACGEVDKGVKALDDLAVADKKLVSDEIFTLVNEFNVAVMAPVADQMNEKGRDKRQMRAVREEALRDVTRMLTVIEKDLRCQTLMSNPFSDATKNAIVAARLALLKVEFTLQTSL